MLVLSEVETSTFTLTLTLSQWERELVIETSDETPSPCRQRYLHNYEKRGIMVSMHLIIAAMV